MRPLTRRTLCAPLLVLFGACATAPKAASSATEAAKPAALAFSLRPLPEAIRWARASAEHRAALLQAYRLATERIESEARKPRPGPWAVVLDADETVLDNSGYQKERAELGRGFDKPSWNEWVRRKASPALPGAVAFLQRVRELGGKIAIVTNRDEEVCPESQEDFRAHDLLFDLMLCQPAGASTDKNPRFEKVANGTAGAGLPPLEILLWVGDNIEDFPRLNQDLRSKPDDAFADFGRRYILIPNAMYGSWERNPER